MGNLKTLIDTISDSGTYKLIQECIDAGLPRKECIAGITDVIDDFIDWTVILPGNPGLAAIIEAGDSTIVKLAVAIVWRRLEKRKAKHATRTMKAMETGRTAAIKS